MGWQSFRVELNGHAEPIEVNTNGLDWSNVVIDPGAPKAMDMTFRVVHAALLRLKVEGVARDYRVFLSEQLAGIPESLDGDEVDRPLDPTPTEP
jgi:hypothetical protein